MARTKPLVAGAALSKAPAIRNLVIVLGDQLDLDSSAFDGFEPLHDMLWMAEVVQEATHVWSSKQRIAVFLTAMRHFAEELRLQRRRLFYRRLDDPQNQGTLHGELRSAIATFRPQSLVMAAPGDWRVLEALRGVARDSHIELEIREDRHFFSTVREFAAYASGRRQLRLEYWYRELRRKHDVLMEPDRNTPLGGAWNFDAQNRHPFPASGPPSLFAPLRFVPDNVTKEVLTLVNSRFAEHPGNLASFSWPVTRAQAAAALKDFIKQRLPLFGRYEDAMWTGEPWLFHSQLSSVLNLKLLNAHETVGAAQQAYLRDAVPLAAAEGFIRQVLGWREYVRGIYWTKMPGLLKLNHLQANESLPGFYWSGQTDMACLREVITQTLEHGYAHHIQRLMVTGLYAMLFGVDPQKVHQWYLSVYVDAVEWVELPNTLAMSQFADGGMMTSKAYAASGKYIQRMSNYCASCRFNPALRSGANACPFTSLYWDFLLRNESVLQRIPRMAMQLKSLKNLDNESRQAIREAAEVHRRTV